MESTLTTEHTAEIFDCFRQRAELLRANEVQRSNSLLYQRILEVSQNIGNLMIGKDVEIAELPIPFGELRHTTQRPINRYVKQPHMYHTHEEPRWVTGETRGYVSAPALLSPHRSTIRGRVVGDDDRHNSFIVRPNKSSRYFVRYWVNPLDRFDEPAIDLKIIEY